jgi:hypothetical protein
MTGPFAFVRMDKKRELGARVASHGFKSNFQNFKLLKVA